MLALPPLFICSRTLDTYTLIMELYLLLTFMCAILHGVRGELPDLFSKNKLAEKEVVEADRIPCTCGVFLDKQLSKNSILSDQENSPIFSYPIQDEEKIFSGLKGRTLCTKKCVELAMKYAQQGPTLLCAALVDLHKQKAHLFIKNYEDKWHSTKLNSGREFCCKDGLPSKCSVL